VPNLKAGFVTHCHKLLCELMPPLASLRRSRWRPSRMSFWQATRGQMGKLRGLDYFFRGLPGRPSEDKSREIVRKLGLYRSPSVAVSVFGTHPSWRAVAEEHYYASDNVDLGGSGPRPLRFGAGRPAALSRLLWRPGGPRNPRRPTRARRRTLLRTDRLLPGPGLLRIQPSLLRQRLGRLLRREGPVRSLLGQFLQSVRGLLPQVMPAGADGCLRLGLPHFNRSSATDPGGPTGSGSPGAPARTNADTPRRVSETRPKRRRRPSLVVRHTTTVWFSRRPFLRCVASALAICKTPRPMVLSRMAAPPGIGVAYAAPLTAYPS
jgi:hypothetical protein